MVPTGVAVFPVDALPVRRFAAMQAADLLVGDVRAFYRRFR